MKILRTPDDCFRNLPGYGFAPHYAEIDGEEAGRLRMHYVDEGPHDGRVVLMLHGQPTWSYLYRKMIPVFAKAGFRAIAPDLIGFGRSDKPAEIGYYTYDRHVRQIGAFLEALNLLDVNLFCQDWGGMIGLRVVTDHPDRFASVTASNTGLPKCEVREPSDALKMWFAFCDSNYPDMPIGDVVRMGSLSNPSNDIIAAYEAPFPTVAHKAGPVAFPKLVPLGPDRPGAAGCLEAWRRLGSWTKPFVTIYSEGDPLNSGTESVFHETVPGSKGQPHCVVTGGHYVQEDNGEELARKTAAFLASVRNSHCRS